MSIYPEKSEFHEWPNISIRIRLSKTSSESRFEFLEATTEVNVNKDVYHIYMGRKYMLLNRRLIEINPLQIANLLICGPKD